MMKRLVSFDTSWLTVVLLTALLVCVFLERKIMANYHARLAAGEKLYEGKYQAAALANAIEQYCLDFPDSGLFTNNREWVERLGGNNPKKIRYLKLESYGRDWSGRLLDPCGAPWVIDVQGSPGFEPRNAEQAANEFIARSCQGFAYGNRKIPRFDRSL